MVRADLAGADLPGARTAASSCGRAAGRRGHVMTSVAVPLDLGVRRWRSRQDGQSSGCCLQAPIAPPPARWYPSRTAANESATSPRTRRVPTSLLSSTGRVVFLIVRSPASPHWFPGYSVRRVLVKVMSG
jgi:hypothetical protein